MPLNQYHQDQAETALQFKANDQHTQPLEAHTKISLFGQQAVNTSELIASCTKAARAGFKHL